MINHHQRYRRLLFLTCTFLLTVLIVWTPVRSVRADPLDTARQVAQADQGTDDSTDTTDAGESPGTGPKGFVQIVFSGGWPGFLIILLLLGLSLTAAYLVFEQIMTLRRSELIPEGLSEQFRELLARGKITEAEGLCRDQPSLLSFVLLNGLGEVDGSWSSVEKALEDAVGEQSARLYRKIEYLSVIGNIAPMVGLLGTVIGMIFAFHQVASSQGSAGAGDLAEGIYQALVTTVGGLIVAIPSLGAFAVFRNRVDQLVVEAAYMAVHAYAPLKRRRRGSKGPPPAPPRAAKQKD